VDKVEVAGVDIAGMILLVDKNQMVFLLRWRGFLC